MTETNALLERIAALETQVNELSAQCRLNDKIHHVINSLHAGVVLHAPDGAVLFSNPAAGKILGLSDDQLRRRRPLDPGWFFLQADGERLSPEDSPVNQVIRSKAPLKELVIGIHRPDLEATTWVVGNAEPIMEGDALTQIAVTFVDITEVKSTAEALRNSQVSMQNIIDHTPLGVCITDEHGVFESVNKSYCAFYGYEEAELIGRHFTLVVPDEHKAALATLHDEFIAQGAEIRGEWEVMTKSGAKKAILADAAHIHDGFGRPKKVTFIMDITREKAFQDRLEEMTRLDALTGVANRRALFQKLESELERAKRYGQVLSIVMLDIDHFKRVNDDYGHQMGDMVLKAVACSISSTIRDVDFVGRYGGEEFLVIMPNTPEQGAVQLAERIRSTVEALRVGDQGLRTTISGGLARNTGEDMTAFIETADKRLYQAKESGRNRIVSA